jgi:UDP-glucose 4-epimerase
MRRIFVTGAATWSGGRLIQQLERTSGVRVFAVDEIDPTIEFSSEFERLGLDRLELARYLLDVEPHTVVHLQTVDRSALRGGVRSHEESIVGAQALFGAIGRCESVAHVIVKSDGAVYGTSPRSPSIVAEDSRLRPPSARYERDLEKVESFVRETAASHDHVDYTILRLAPIFGPTVGNPLSRYLTLPGVPSKLGFDPRLQLIGENDAVRAFLHVIDHPISGTFNIAAEGHLYLSRVIRLGRRIPQPLPSPLFHAALRGLARLDLVVPKHIVALLESGRVVDTSRMRDRLGFEPRLTGRQVVLSGYQRIHVEDTVAP